jgi:hypothetical protein
MSGLELLAPAGLIALLGVPLVVLYHMRQTTPVVRDVPSLRFWRVAMREEADQERFKRPPITLLFILHLLLVGLLAFALARPAASRAIGGFASRTEPSHVILLLDGSTSMSATDPLTGKPLFESARKVALDRLGNLREGDVATVILMGTHSSTYEATDTAGLRSVEDRLRSVPLPGGRADLNAALDLTADLMLPSMRDEVVVITDGAVAANPSVVERVGASIELVSLSGGNDNVAITDIATKASPSNPGEQQLYVRIANFGAAPVTAPVVISADGIELSRADVTIDPNGDAEELTQDLPAGATTVDVQVDAIDVLPADNRASSVLVQGNEFGLRILYVADVPTKLQRALAVLPGAKITLASPTEAAATRIEGAFDLVVYEHALPPTSLPNAPVLLVNPPVGGLIPMDGVMANPIADRVSAQDPLLRGVELAGVTFGQTSIHRLDATATEVVGATGGPLIYRATAPETGQPMVVMAFDVALSNLPQRVAFPILMANIANELAPSPLPAAAALGEPLVYRPRPGAATVRITPPVGEPLDLAITVDDETGSEQGAPPAEPLRETTYADTGQPGQYLVTELDAKGNEIGVGRFVVNAGHPRESDLTPNAELAGVLSQAKPIGDAGEASSLADLWPALAAAAFLLLLLEWLVTLIPRRRVRRARRPVMAPAR